MDTVVWRKPVVAGGVGWGGVGGEGQKGIKWETSVILTMIKKKYL